MLKQWASGLTDKRTQLQTSLAELVGAVGQIEERTSAITKDLTNKVHHLLIIYLKQLFVFSKFVFATIHLV